MLFFLTGDIQTGKTRWLQQVLGKLEGQGVQVCGVIAPGVWREHRAAGETAAYSGNEEVIYEKLGIDNVLLPSRRRIAFARRVDLVDDAEWEGACMQAREAGLAWAIRDEAIAEVNAHFSSMLEMRVSQSCLDNSTETIEKGGAGDGDAPTSLPGGLVVVDEFGRLELLHDQGLTAAAELIDRGATERYSHALVVVRQQLLSCAKERFACAPWGGMEAILPDYAGENTIFDSLNVSLPVSCHRGSEARSSDLR